MSKLVSAAFPVFVSTKLVFPCRVKKWMTRNSGSESENLRRGRAEFGPSPHELSKAPAPLSPDWPSHPQAAPSPAILV